MGRRKGQFGILVCLAGGRGGAGPGSIRGRSTIESAWSLSLPPLATPSWPSRPGLPLSDTTGRQRAHFPKSRMQIGGGDGTVGQAGALGARGGARETHAPRGMRDGHGGAHRVRRRRAGACNACECRPRTSGIPISVSKSVPRFAPRLRSSHQARHPSDFLECHHLRCASLAQR